MNILISFYFHSSKRALPNSSDLHCTSLFGWKGKRNKVKFFCLLERKKIRKKRIICFPSNCFQLKKTLIAALPIPWGNLAPVSNACVSPISVPTFIPVLLPSLLSSPSLQRLKRSRVRLYHVNFTWIYFLFFFISFLVNQKHHNLMI